MRTQFYNVVIEDQDVTRWVTSVNVVEDDRQTDSVSLNIADPRGIYADGLLEGCIAEVDIGYAEPNEHALMIRALITKVETSYPNDGTPALVLKGQDLSIQMGLVEKKVVWRDRTVSDIVREVADAYGFADVVVELNPDPTIGRKPIHQDGKTDLAFLQDLAKKYAAKCFVELNEGGEEVLYFIPERRVLTARRADRINLRYRSGPASNLRSFSPTFDSNLIDRLKLVSDIDDNGEAIESQKLPRVDSVEWELDEIRLGRASSRDRDTIRSIFQSARERKNQLQAQLAERQVTVGVVAPNQEELDHDDQVLETHNLGMTATASAPGNVWLRAKSIVDVRGVSMRFDGEWYVHNVTHKVDTSGYTTDFKCVR